MINLAGRKDCDSYIEKELREAGVQLRKVKPDLIHNEVPYSIEGKLGEFKFSRAWTYWVVDGEVPLYVAEEIYATYDGKKYIRADGHCGCLEPKLVASYYLKNGKKLISDPEGKQKKEFEHCIEHNLFEQEQMIIYEFVIDRTKCYDYAVVDCYHIDTQDGLNLFSEIIKQRYYNI